jgi:rfaE bifunctional protein kinase chain/domain
MNTEKPLLSQAERNRLFEGFEGLRVMVVGDVMIDAYYWGKVDRISPEAPVPVVQITRREHRLGGAANVALNIKALGAEPIICSVIGDDEKGGLLEQLLTEHRFIHDGMVTSSNRITTVKTRVISGGQHLLRVDEESTIALSITEEKPFIARCESLIESGAIDVVIFEDYNKGVLTEGVIRAVSAKAKAKGIPVAVDPKKNQFFSYIGVDLFKPNFKELVEGLKIELNRGSREGLINAIDALEKQLHNRCTLVTLSEHGVAIRENGVTTFIDAHKREIVDVSGAGDTVISVAAMCLALRADAPTIAALSNLAGGLVCENVGVVPIDRDRLFEETEKLMR